MKKTISLIIVIALIVLVSFDIYDRMHYQGGGVWMYKGEQQTKYVQLECDWRRELSEYMTKQDITSFTIVKQKNGEFLFKERQQNNKIREYTHSWE